MTRDFLSISLLHHQSFLDFSAPLWVSGREPRSCRLYNNGNCEKDADWGETIKRSLSYCDMISRQYKHRLRSCKGRFSRSDYVTEEILKVSVSETTISGVSKPRGFPNIDAGSQGVLILGGITLSVFFFFFF
jgi:hypothetical protein